jgi:glycosyltransferase involved in cell wall biosynthesis
MERAVYHLAKQLRALGAEPVLYTRPATQPGEFPGRVEMVRYASIPAGAHGRVLDRTLNYPGFVARVGAAVAPREEVERLLGVNASRVVVLPNGIDPEEIAELTPADPEGLVLERLPELRGANPLFLSVGRLEAYKGFGDVLAALERLHVRGELPSRWAWVVVGEGPEQERLAARAAASLAPHVTLAGRVEDRLLHALYARADVFLHATRYEGSSLVTLEAMAHALPVCATRAGGIPDKVVEGRTGYLSEPGDLEGLACRIRQLARQPEQRRALGDAGRARALALFSYEQLLIEARA